LGEFGMSTDGYKGFTQVEWYRAYFEQAARNGVSGAMFWILTPDPERGYGVAYASPRDAALLEAINGSSHLFASLVNASPPPALLSPGHHLVPRQFAFARAPNEKAVQPQVVYQPSGAILYRFWPNMVVSGRFEKLGGGEGYIWGGGAGYFEYIVPARKDFRRVGRIVVRAHIQPILPNDAKPSQIKTQVTLFLNGNDCGSRLIGVEDPSAPLIQEWQIDSFSPRLEAARGKPLAIRFAVTPASDWLYGINISNWPMSYKARESAPVEVEIN